MNNVFSKELLRSKLNEVYRTKVILENYLNNTLRNSEFIEANGKVLDEVKTRCILLCKDMINKISYIVKRELKCQDFMDPIECCVNLLSDEHFFETRELLSQIIEVYDKNYNVLVDEFRINPLDKVKFYKLKFVQ
ncbi:MAG: hypothetical protein AABY07_09120 [Nanoarchaeota archaeon]